MVLNIKDPETDGLARELARETGESITTALRTAVRDRLAAVRAQQAAKPSGLDEIIARGRARRNLDLRSAEEILGYDEHGLPA
ncbi:type II toxin-antitoxin system antitoxin VapB30 [Myceligenerans halotolerans]